MRKVLCALLALILVSCAMAEPGPVTGGCQAYNGMRDWKWPVREKTCDITSCFIDIYDVNAVSTDPNVFVRTVGHFGLDILGTGNVYASYEGVVEDVYKNCYHAGPCECNAGFGNSVVIRHKYLASNNETGRDEYITVYSQYSHMAANSVWVNPGEKVTTKSILGKVGATGKTKGSHLDFRIVYTGNTGWCYMDKFSVDPFMCEFFEESIVPDIRLKCSKRSLACCEPYRDAVEKLYGFSDDEEEFFW